MSRSRHGGEREKVDRLLIVLRLEILTSAARTMADRFKVVSSQRRLRLRFLCDGASLQFSSTGEEVVK